MADLNLEELERLHEAAFRETDYPRRTAEACGIDGEIRRSFGAMPPFTGAQELFIESVQRAFPALLAKARLAEKAAEFLRAHINASKSELDELRNEFGILTCPHCDEPLVESEGVEGPHGNLWHYRCLESWREDV